MSAHAHTPADVERIAKSLGGAGKNGSGWDCRCPAHDDHRASLSLTIGDDGKLLWHCHTGCEQMAVLQAMERAGVLLNGDARAAEPKRKARKRIVATYPYTDESGQVLDEKVRYEPKGFVQRLPDGTYKLGDVSRVLYHLSDVIAAAEVVIVEGEKDANRLRSLGFTATTNVEGASKDTQKPKWRKEYSATLAGKHLVFIPDKDAAGQAHMENAARSCIAAGAASVRLIQLEGLPPKGDVSDWLDARHTADELRELIAKAPEWKPPAKGDPGWRSRLLEGDNGYLANEHNVLIVLRHAPELVGRLRFNELSHTAEGSNLPWQPAEQGWRAWTDNDDTALAAWLQGCGVNVHPSRVAAAVQVVAGDRKHHPIRAYLDGLQWDGTTRLDGWLATYLGVAFADEGKVGLDEEQKKAAAAKNTYLREVGRKALIQAVARIYQPGCKADHALILEGPQGTLKSSAVRALAKDEAWFADEVSDLGSKDSAQDLRGKWIIELAELSAMKRSDIERTKAFMSRATDHYRPSYGRRSQDHPRQCVFFGTTNADNYLGDETGGRRFWPVKVGTIKLDELRRDREQIWAEAVVAFKAGERWWLSAAVEKAAAEAQAERRIVDVWEEALLDWAGRQVLPFTISTALTEAVRVPIERQDRSAQMRVAAAFKANGWVRTRSGAGDRSWRYERKTAPPAGEVGTEVGTSEVGTDGVGWDEVGTPQKQAASASYKHPSQPSQPKTNVSKSVQTAESDVKRGV